MINVQLVSYNHNVSFKYRNKRWLSVLIGVCVWDKGVMNLM